MLLNQNEKKNQFLSDLAKYLFHNFNEDFSQLLLIFPTYSASQNLYKEFSEFTRKSMWMPKALTLADFIKTLSPLRIVSINELIPILHSVYHEVSNNKKGIEKSYFFYERLQYDFNLIDIAGIDVEELDEDKYLTNDLFSYNEFLASYKKYTKILLERKIGYTGLCYREAYRSIMQQSPSVIPGHVAVVGFAAFSPIEESIFSILPNYTDLNFYWDINEDYINNEEKKAGTFLRSYKRNALFKDNFYLFQNQIACTKIDILETQTRVAQVHAVDSRIAELIDGENKALIGNIAIILKNTDLLIPILYALPVNVAEANIRLKYPIQHTSVYSLIIRLIDFYLSQLTAPSGILKLELVESILASPILADETETKEVSNIIVQTHNSYMSIIDLCKDDTILYNILNATAYSELIDYLLITITIIRLLVKKLSTSALEFLALNAIENKLIDLKETINSVENVDAFTTLIKNDIQQIQLLVNHQTKSSVHILSIENTACLDYDYIFILDATEANYPSETKRTGFIATNKFDDLTRYFDYKETTDAYLFYRLLHRSKEIVALYDSTTSEMSRYLLQIYYEFPNVTTKSTKSPPVSLSKPVPIVIEKDHDVMSQIQKFNLKQFPNAIALTPSGITTYVDCSLKFYFRYIEKLKHAKKRDPFAKDAMFGTVLHKTMEVIYKPFLANKNQKHITQQDIESIVENLEDTVELLFKSIFEASIAKDLLPREGYNVIAKEVIIKCIKKILVLDTDYAPFVIIGLEEGRYEPLFTKHKISPNCSIRLGGVIDRIDLKDAVIRILDYKTGAVNPKISSVGSLFDRDLQNKNNPVLQIFLYAWILNKSGIAYEQKITPCLLSTRQIFGHNTDFNIYMKDGTVYIPILDIGNYMNDITVGLDKIIGELFDENVPFLQTENRNRCSTCEYAKICQRG